MKTTFFNLQHKRIELSKEVKNELLLEYNNTCNHCEKEFPKHKLQFDHIIPLTSGGTNELENIQGLCVDCHKIITDIERNNSEYIYINRSESSFNKEVEAVVNSDLSKS